MTRVLLEIVDSPLNQKIMKN